MPIDFNPHIQFNSSINTPHRIIQQSVAFTGQLEKDTFTKSVKVDSSNADNKYEGLKIEKKSFGTIKKTGEEATLYTITNKNGASVDLSTFGATITGIKIPDKDGNIKDVTQGYDNFTPYE